MLLAEEYDFDDDDIVIKLTGIYTIEKGCAMIDTVIKESEAYDAFIKWYNICTNEYHPVDYILGLYALRYRYLREFNHTKIRWHPSMEHVFAQHIRDCVPPDRIKDLTHIGMYYRGDTSLLF